MPATTYRRRRRLRTLSGVGAAVVIVAVCPGCGSEADDSDAPEMATIESKQDVIVSPADIEAAPSDTPERTVLEWWQALQFQDLKRVKDSYADGVDRDSVDVQMTALSPFLTTSTPSIYDVSETEDQAKVLAIIVTGDFTQTSPGEPPQDVIESPTTLLLEREGEGSKWLLADNRFLEQRLEAQQAATAAAESGDSGSSSSPPEE